MSKPIGEQHPSNYPKDGDAFSIMLEEMSVDELMDALDDALEHTTMENYNSSVISAYLAALDRKDPIPEILDVEAAYADFQRRVRNIFPEYQKPKHNRRFRRVWRMGLVAVFSIVCMFGVMVVAQAAGVNVFGAMAHWTDNVFSFGEIRSDGAVDVPNDTAFTSLQEALDVYGITEVAEPTWLPDGYTFMSVVADHRSNGDFIGLAAEYSNGAYILHVEFSSYQDEPSMQIEKTDAPVETFVVNDTIVYLLENIKNNAAAWMTEHFECIIAGPIDKTELRQMVLSIYADV